MPARMLLAIAIASAFSMQCQAQTPQSAWQQNGYRPPNSTWQQNGYQPPRSAWTDQKQSRGKAVRKQPNSGAEVITRP
jgi:hypothetical protein